ncbi:hypothetical protein AX777_18195 [Sphingobium yanoikuyae]|uniref:Holin n=1 Tax=Sphingobium yanoikuyae TaxID=13690 RepID=A0A177J7B9_SPHYA|nr:hypothetical protein [Sphingobium yanoikuyae]OAH36970.1 hypothetical protein AX777_18195 [Sphingobium yanoikuyae]
MGIKDRLISDWRKAYKLWSVRLSALGLAAMTAWPSIPQEIREEIPGQRWIAAGIFAAVILGRLINQEKKDGE